MWSQVCAQSGSHSDQDTLKAVKYFLKNEDVIRKATCLATPSLGHRSSTTLPYTLGHYFPAHLPQRMPGDMASGASWSQFFSLHFEQRHAAYFARLGWSKAQRDSHNLRKNPAAVPILSPTFPLAATFTLARYIRGHLLLLRHSKCWEDPEKRVRN